MAGVARAGRLCGMRGLAPTGGANTLSGRREYRSKIERPLSPHLTIYRFPYNAWFSIATRLTGMSLTFGFAGAGIAALMVKDFGAFAEAMKVTNPGLVGVAKGGLAFSMSYHTITGCRHLVWDKYAMGVTVPQVAQTSTAAFGAAAVVTTAMLFFQYSDEEKAE